MYYTVQYTCTCIILYCNVLYCTVYMYMYDVMYYTVHVYCVLYCTVLYCTLLYYCTVHNNVYVLCIYKLIDTLYMLKQDGVVDMNLLS